MGAVVTIENGGAKQLRVVQSGSSYLSQDDKRLHFGLGAATKADSIDVTWPDGTHSTLRDVRVDRVLEVSQYVAAPE